MEELTWYRGLESVNRIFDYYRIDPSYKKDTIKYLKDHCPRKNNKSAYVISPELAFSAFARTPEKKLLTNIIIVVGINYAKHIMML